MPSRANRARAAATRAATADERSAGAFGEELGGVGAAQGDDEVEAVQGRAPRCGAGNGRGGGRARAGAS